MHGNVFSLATAAWANNSVDPAQPAYCNKQNPLLGNWMFSNNSVGLEGAFQFSSDGLYTSSNIDDLPTTDFPVGYYGTGLFGQWKKIGSNTYAIQHVEKIANKNTMVPGLPALVDQNIFPPSPLVGYTVGKVKITGPNSAHLSVIANVYPVGTVVFTGPPLFSFPIELDMYRLRCDW